MADPSKSLPTGNSQGWLLPTAGKLREGLVAEVAVLVRTTRLYHYAIPEDLADRVRVGTRVSVPYGRGRRAVEGICIRTTTDGWRSTLKPISAIVGDEPLLTASLVALALWVSDYYACPPGTTLAALLPQAVRAGATRKVTFVRLAATPDGPRPPTERQQAVLDALADEPLPRRQLRTRTGATDATLRTLEKRGWIALDVREIDVAESDPAPASEVTPEPGASTPEDAHVLNAAQSAALDAVTSSLSAGRFATHVLFGVPGSGKTEVYVRAIRAALAAGKQAILVVPEIALATQIVTRLARRFERVAVLHSQLSPRQRAAALQRAASGAVDVVIGTRTAVFAPCKSLGLIVIDEEQESSLKSLAAPLYHARDVALKRGQLENVPIVLGSATPSLETWHNAHHLPHFALHRLPERAAGAVPPTVKLVPMAGRELGQTTDLLSPTLIAALRETLAAGDQAILLHNRRGYAVFLRCTRCGLMVTCPRCDGPLVLHRSDNTLRCHRCGQRAPAPATCPDSTCNGSLERSGLAIQRLEEELMRALPAARLLRLDRDTMRRRADYEAALLRFANHEADVLLGTQMVAKGLDFPRVRLVGVVDADAGLWLPDFRAAESTFSLLMQVVGRAGRRDGPSLALVQTGERPAPVVQQAVKMDYEAFARDELQRRNATFDPPASRLVRLILADPRPGKAREAAEALPGPLRKVAGRVNSRIRVSPAAPCVVGRLRGLFRWEILIRAPRDASAQRLLHAARDAKLLNPRVERFTIDVDPVDLM